MKTNPSDGTNEMRPTRRSNFSKTGLVVIVALVGLFLFLTGKKPETPVPPVAEEKPIVAEATPAAVPLVETPQTPPPVMSEHGPQVIVGEEEDPELTALIEQYPALVPQQLELTKKVLVSKKWNTELDGFGLNKPPEGQEGDVIAPSSVMAANGTVYLLDNVQNRILSYDKDGKLLSTANLPSGGLAMDLVFNPSDSSIFVIDHYADKIHVVKGSEVKTFESVPLRESLIIGARFGYDTATGTLWAQDMENGGNVSVAVMRNGEIVKVSERATEMFAPVTVNHQAEKLIVTTREGQAVTVPMEKTVECVEQVETDSNGVVWVLFTLAGDNQKYNVARIDLAQNTAGVTPIDLFFTYDGTRRMAATENGLVFFTSDEKEGHVVALNQGRAL